MFNDLDDTLRALLTSVAPGAPLELRNADIVFTTPDQLFTPAQDTVNLFLYGVNENRQMRDPAPIIERNNGMYERRRAPIRVDCAYMITAWSTATGEVKIAREHRLLALALAWLSNFPLIPVAFRQGSIVTQPFDPPTMVAQMDNQQHVGEFWSALGVPPRPSFTLVVTIALELDSQIEGPPVVTSELRFEQMDVPGAVQEISFTIGGSVRNAVTLDPIPDADVTLVEPGWTVQTDEQGHFIFTGVEAGAYTLAVSALGFPAAPPQAITVPGAVLNAYDVDLTP